ncbi:MAG: site-specific integrase [Halodesulfurarchaeum sp.]
MTEIEWTPEALDLLEGLDTEAQERLVKKLDSEDAEAVPEYLDTYEYASRPHVTLALFWHPMLRRGAARALDVEDDHPKEQCLEVRHRPEEDTPIKNGFDGERFIGLSGWLCQLLDDWLRDRRPDVTAEYGREPLLATQYGRPSRTTLPKYAYRYTRPCAYGRECPHRREPDSCEAVETEKAPKCPSSISPHAIRRRSITHHLAEDIPETAVSDRANVSQRVLEQHYDRRSQREKMEQRRQYLDQLERYQTEGRLLTARVGMVVAESGRRCIRLTQGCLGCRCRTPFSTTVGRVSYPAIRSQICSASFLAQ